MKLCNLYLYNCLRHLSFIHRNSVENSVSSQIPHLQDTLYSYSVTDLCDWSVNQPREEYPGSKASCYSNFYVQVMNRADIGCLLELFQGIATHISPTKHTDIVMNFHLTKKF